QGTDSRRARNPQPHRRSLQEPGYCDLDNARATSLARPFQRIVRFQPSASADRKPWHKPKTLLLAIDQNIFRLAVLSVVLVLDAYYRKDFARPLDFLRLHVG